MLLSLRHTSISVSIRENEVNLIVISIVFHSRYASEVSPILSYMSCSLLLQHLTKKIKSINKMEETWQSQSGQRQKQSHPCSFAIVSLHFLSHRTVEPTVVIPSFCTVDRAVCHRLQRPCAADNSFAYLFQHRYLFPTAAGAARCGNVL